MSGWSGLARRNARRMFRDRRDAGHVLADELTSYRGQDDLLVLGLARGGVPVAWQVAPSLRAPLDVFLVRKLGVPQWQELAMGALASGGGVVDQRQPGAQPRHQRRGAAGRDRARDRRVEPPRAGVPRRPPARRPRGQDRDPGRRRDRHRRQHARRGAGGAGRESGAGGRRGPGRTAVGVPGAGARRPTTWCARRCRRDSKPSGRCSPTSTRSPTTKYANCLRHAEPGN